VEWFEELYDKTDESDGIRELFDNIDMMVADEEYDKLDHFLAIVDLKRLTNTMLVGMVRVPFPAHKNLSKWRDAVNRVANELTRRGLAADKLLAGLFDTSWYTSDIASIVNKLPGLKSSSS
jgi:hypothetical protein